MGHEYDSWPMFFLSAISGVQPMKTRHITTVTHFILLTCVGLAAHASQDPVSVPVGGNSWVTNASDSRSRIISRNGIEKWTSKDTSIRTFFHVPNSGKINIALRAKVISGRSQLSCTLGGVPLIVTLENTEYKTIPVGTFMITQPGYQYLDMQGLT
jgi:hypothetical protein